MGTRTELGTSGRTSVTPQRQDEAGKWVAATPRTAERWVAKARVRDRDGALRQIKRNGATKAKAEGALKAALRDREGKVSTGTVREDMTVQALADLWLEQIKRSDSGKAPRTLTSYRGSVANHLPRVASLTVREVNRVSVVRRYLQSVADEVGTGAAKTARTVLASIIDLAVADDVVPVNAVRQVSPAKASTKLETVRDTSRALTRAERDHLLAVADAVVWKWAGEDVADVLAWMAGTGVRISEALGQRWEDVSLTERTALIRGTKTASAERLVHLPPWLVKRLEKRGGHGFEGMVFPSPGNPNYRNSPVDPSKPRDGRNVARILREMLDAAGLPWATPHTLRRTAATLLDQAGRPVAAIARQLGHSDPSMTMRVYLDRHNSDPAAADVL